MKKLLFFLATSLFAQCPIDCAYLPASNYLKNSAMYVSFDFLFWEGTERGLEFASKNAKSFFDQDVQIYEPAFGFHPAFRLGVGYHLPHDNWDVDLIYTFYYCHNTNYAHHNFGGNPNGGIRSIWTSSTAFQRTNFRVLWQNSEAKWKLHANLFDLYLKHRLCLSSAVTIEPAFGIKFALLQQGYKVVYENGNTASNLQGTALIQFLSSSISMKNRSLNVGPTASIMTRWNLSQCFDLLGSLSSSLLSSRFSVGRNEWDVSLNPTIKFDSVRESTTYWIFRPQAAALFGLSWNNCICQSNSVIYYGFSASYETQVYWKQNMLYRFIDQTNPAMIAPTQGDLFFHGLTLDAFIDF